MSALTEWLDRIRRSRLAAVVGAYTAASFGILQVADIFTNHLGLPGWVFPFAVLLLVVGLPIVVATALLQAPPSTPPEPAPAHATARPTRKRPRAARSKPPNPHWLTWKRALLGGAGAFALLALVTGGYMAMRALGIGPVGTLIAKGALKEREPVLVADLRAPRGDTLLAATVSDAFRIDLAQSPVLTVLEADFVRAALRRMEYPESSHLDAALAREVAQREGIGAVITGELDAIGGGYVLAAQIVTADSGRVLATFQEQARDSTQLLPALDRLAQALRERVGESLRTIRAAPPLEQVTTASLPALRAYSRAVRLAEEGEQEGAATLLESAIAQDSGFAMAYRKLSVALSSIGGERGRELDAIKHAYVHRNRLTDPERAVVEASYYMVQNQWLKAAQSYEGLLAVYPDNVTAVSNLGIMYFNLRRLDDAERAVRRAVRLHPSNIVDLGNLLETLVANGKLAEADAMFAGVPERYRGSWWSFYYAWHLAAAQADYAAAQAAGRAAIARYASDPVRHVDVQLELAELAALQGRLSEARSLFQSADGDARHRGPGRLVVLPVVAPVLIDAIVLQDTVRAGRELDAAALDTLMSGVPAAERSYLQLGYVSALAGRPGRARRYLNAYDAAVVAELRDEPGRHALLGLVALDEGRTAQAAQELRAADDGPCRYCALPDLGRAYEAAGLPDSARAVYERYLRTYDFNRIDSDWLWLPTIHERLARLYAVAGDRPLAAHHAAVFLKLWARADAELQPRVEAMRRLLTTLSPDAAPGNALPGD